MSQDKATAFSSRIISGEPGASGCGRNWAVFTTSEAAALVEGKIQITGLQDLLSLKEVTQMEEEEKVEQLFYWKNKFNH